MYKTLKISQEDTKSNKYPSTIFTKLYLELLVSFTMDYTEYNSRKTAPQKSVFS